MFNKIFIVLIVLSSVKLIANKCLSDHSGKNKVSNQLQSIDDFQRYVDSELGNFRVHFDTTGLNAVDALDANSNGIPDYVDSVLYYAEDVRQFYLDLGWPEVPIDSVGSFAYGGSAAYDILIQSIDFYGGVQGISSLSDPFYGLPSYMFINNKYNDSILFETTGYEAVKITLAHEYFHSIQYSYPDANNNMTFNLYEMTATFFESQYVSGNTDYFRYVENSIFDSPENFSLTLDYGLGVYAWAVYFIYLDEMYGGDIIKMIWENSANQNFLETVNQFLDQQNTTFNPDWKNFLTWIYYTGKRSRSEFGFSNAPDWPEIILSAEEDIKNDLLTRSSEQKNLTFSLSRFTTPTTNFNSPDTVDVLVTRINNSNSSIGDDTDYPYEYYIAGNQFDESKEIENSSYFYDLDGNLFEAIHFFRPGNDLTEISHSFPNPFDPDLHSLIKFPVAAEVNLFVNCELIIYSENLVPIFQKRFPVNNFNEFKIVEVEFSELSLQSGVYFFRTEHNSNSIFGKFVVLK